MRRPVLSTAASASMSLLLLGACGATDTNIEAAADEQSSAAPEPDVEAEAPEDLAGEGDLPTDEPSEDVSERDLSDPGETPEKPLELSENQVGRDGGDFKYTVTSFTPDAFSMIKAENEFNDPPENGQFVLVGIAATYEGDDTASAYFGLDINLYGADNKVYDQCFGVLPDDLSSAPEVRAGGEAEGNVCFDIPPEALPATIGIEESFSFDGGEAVFFGPVS